MVVITKNYHDFDDGAVTRKLQSPEKSAFGKLR